MKKNSNKKASITALIIAGAAAVVIIIVAFCLPHIYNAVGKIGHDYYRFETNGVSYSVVNPKEGEHKFKYYELGENGQTVVAEVAVKQHINFFKMTVDENAEIKLPKYVVSGDMYNFGSNESSKRVFDAISEVINEMPEAASMAKYDEYVFVCVNKFLFMIDKRSDPKTVDKIMPSGKRSSIGEYAVI